MATSEISLAATIAALDDDFTNERWIAAWREINAHELVNLDEAITAARAILVAYRKCTNRNPHAGIASPHFLMSIGMAKEILKRWEEKNGESSNIV
jgi:hypothetical protein